MINPLLGDFNHDGTVDAADYVMWRKNPGGSYTPDDYTTWRANFGQTFFTLESAASSGASIVNRASDIGAPEPTSLALLMFSAGIAVSLNRRR